MRITPLAHLLERSRVGGKCQRQRAARAEELGARFEELENFFVLFRGEISANAHVHQRYFPLGRTQGTGRSNIMTTYTILRPKLRAAFSRRSGSDLSRLLIRRATNQPRQGNTRNNDRRPRQTDPLANPR